MMKKFLAAGLILAAASVASASVTYSLSDVTLDAVNGNYQGPEFQHGTNAWTVDVLVNLNSSDDWTAGGLVGTTQAGSSWYYFEPNLAPGPQGSSAAPGKFATAVTLPKSQFATGRFTSLSNFAMAGSYKPASPTAVANANEVNVAWLETPPQTTTLDTNGAIVRLTLLHTLTADQTGVYFDSVQRNPNDVLLASIEVASGSVETTGLAIVNYSAYATVIPEPASLALLALGGLMGLRRR